LNSSTAKAVNTDFTLEFLKKQAEADAEFSHHPAEQGQETLIQSTN
jgi:hypothetical protein